ncbi:DUF2790 domain-containing protein [Pseudomonas aeruginosa]|uniref:DUF2790 domain-containing protein n=1 Tax=Pseudomonas aeruginosa TaxID=287 RepID=UPI0011875D1D|nr:DUF2790 domain-containing protein [Pseudomonas aeruginosa]
MLDSFSSRSDFFYTLKCEEPVIGLTPTYGKCGIMPAQMSYVDSKGEINILEYRTSGSSCRNEN